MSCPSPPPQPEETLEYVYTPQWGRNKLKKKKRCSIVYEWDVHPDGMPGTFWYHAHHHGVTDEQVSAGALGLLIKEAGANYFSNAALEALFANERTAVTSSSGPVTVWNLQHDQWYVGRILVANPNGNGATYDVGTGCTVYELGSDGVLYFQVFLFHIY